MANGGFTRGAAGGLTLRRNFAWTAIGNIVYAACQWGIVTMLAKTSGTEAVGLFALGLAITAPISIFLQLQLRAVQATDVKDGYEFQEYLALRVLTTAVALIISVAVIGASGLRSTAAVVVGLIAMAKAIDSISDIFYGAFQQREQMDLIAKPMMANGLLSLVLMTIGILATSELWVGVVGYLLGSLLPLFLFVIPVQKRHLSIVNRTAAWFRWDRGRIVELTRMALPLGVSVMFISLTANVPRYIIEHWLGTAALGIFAAIGYLIIAGTTVIGALGQSALPRLAANYAAGQYRQFRMLLLRLMVGGVALGIAGLVLSALAGRKILSIIYTSEFAPYSRLLMVLSIAAGLGFASSFAGYGLTAVRKFSVLPVIYASVLVVSIVASLILIPRYGLLGAAYGLIVTGLAQLVCSTVVLYRSTETPKAIVS